jgi:hypothetical protein
MKKNCCSTFFVAKNIIKFKFILVLNWEEKKLGQFTKNYRNFLHKNLSLSSQKYRLGIREPEKTYTGCGVKKAPAPGFWIRISNTDDTVRTLPVCVNLGKLPAYIIK